MAARTTSAPRGFTVMMTPEVGQGSREALSVQRLAVNLRRAAPSGSTACWAASDIWLVSPSVYGSIKCMKKTLHIDEALLRRAKTACRATTDTDTVRLGLEALVRHAAYERLRSLRGVEPSARDVPRRREQPGRHKAA